MKQSRTVVIGAGNAGSVVANSLSKRGLSVTVIEPSEYHLYQPGLVDVIVGDERPESVIKPINEVLDPHIELVKDRAIKVLPEERKVITSTGKEINYDYLVISPGVQNVKGKLPAFHTLDEAINLKKMVESFEGKNIIVGYYGIIKCPAAPFELAFLLKQKFPKAKVTLLNPVSQPPELQKPMAEKLGKRSSELNVEVIRGAKIRDVDTQYKVIEIEDGQRLKYDLALIDTPIKVGNEFSNLVDNSGFIPVGKQSLQLRGYDDVYVIGDATDIMLPPKTGAIAHYEALHVVKSIVNKIYGYGKVQFDGSAMCAVYGGEGDGFFVYMNYSKSKAFGPSPVFRSAKKAFQSLYWLSLKGVIDPFLEFSKRFLSGGP
jgi:sulfide:quinone oxidoreductase